MSLITIDLVVEPVLPKKKEPGKRGPKKLLAVKAGKTPMPYSKKSEQR